MTRYQRIPWLPILIGCGFLLMMVWSFYAAGHRSSAVTDPDYYSHGLRYNQTLLEQQAAASLGWSMSVRLSGEALLIVLEDARGQAISGASGQLSLLKGRAMANMTLPLRETLPGTYRVALPAGLSGEQPVLVNFESDGARLGKRFLLALP